MGELLHGGLRRIVVVLRYFEGFYVFQIIQTPLNNSRTHVLLNIELFCRLWAIYARFMNLPIFTRLTDFGCFCTKNGSFVLADLFFIVDFVEKIC